MKLAEFLEEAQETSDPEILRLVEALSEVVYLHRKADPRGQGAPWCNECIKGWDEDDFNMIAWPCKTIRTLCDELEVEV